MTVFAQKLSPTTNKLISEKEIDKAGFRNPGSISAGRFRSTASCFGDETFAEHRARGRRSDKHRRSRGKLNQHPALAEVNLIVPIQTHARSMFKDSIDAVVREDVELARAGVSRDKQLDDMNASVNRGLTEG